MKWTEILWYAYDKWKKRCAKIIKMSGVWVTLLVGQEILLMAKRVNNEDNDNI
jgi:hypothetical protein